MGNIQCQCNKHSEKELQINDDDIKAQGETQDITVSKSKLSNIDIFTPKKTPDENNNNIYNKDDISMNQESSNNKDSTNNNMNSEEVYPEQNE